jgi:hypothetical protein
VAVLAAATMVVLVGGPAMADSSFGTRPVSVVHQPRVSATAITAVATGIHPGYDRIVITTKGPLPGYSVGFVSQVFNDPKGTLANVPGKAYLRVTVHEVNWMGTLPIPASRSVGGPEIQAVVITQQFEGYVTYALGLRSRTAFRVFTLTRPDRLVVDVADPTAGVTLPATGAPVGPVALLGLGLLAAGVALRRHGPAAALTSTDVEPVS